MIKKFVSLSLVLLFVTSSMFFRAQACTVAVISGKATPDGRPILWKNRDTSHKANRIANFQGEKYSFIGLVNSTDEDNTKVWAGVNSSGFCIMNSLSYNLNLEAKKNSEEPRKLDHGLMMKRALGLCATVEDFEKLLSETAGKRHAESNYGVIDAHGGAAFFEVDDNSYVRFDATDPKLAPEGYIVRSNFSYTGDPGEGAGYIRYDRAQKLFHEAVSTGGISSDWLLLHGSRDMVNGLTGHEPLSASLPAHSGDRRMIYMADSFARNTAASTILFHGVKEGENPGSTVMWTRLGHPLCSVAVPLREAAGDAMAIVRDQDKNNAPLDRFALHLHEKVFPMKGGSRDKYLDLAQVINRTDGGILPKLLTIEKEILKKEYLSRSAAPNNDDSYVQMQREIERLAIKLLIQHFPEVTDAVGIKQN